MAITLQPLTLANLADYERLTQHGDEGQACYCSFWHAKWASMDHYHQVQRDEPERLRESVVQKVKSGFHVGVVAYDSAGAAGPGVPCAWISVGPLTDFFWTWRRVAQVGEAARSIAGIVCFTLAPEYRGRGFQLEVLSALKEYGRAREWSAIEGYPFADSAIATHGDKLKWAGLTNGFERAGFERVGDHWLNHPDYMRSIYSLQL
jgi:GNAT superfamily N-acetyltransferase